MNDGELAALESRLGHRFSRHVLLSTALRHRSSVLAAGENNETLEFLGDAVIQLVVSDLLLRAWPGEDEGSLSRRRAALVNARSLADKAQALGLGELLMLGRGEEKTGGRGKRSILAGAFEAVMGAVFVDGGFAPAHEVCRRIFAADVLEPIDRDAGDFKTQLQEIAQRLYHETPVYELLRTSGPDHAKDFESHVSVGGRVLGAGSGRSKKHAEQAAAREALARLGEDQGSRQAGDS
jgi:ribonuclease-3